MSALEKHLVRFSFFHTFATARPNLFLLLFSPRSSVNIAENWALVADGGHGNDAPLADYAHRAGERGVGISPST